MIKTRHGEVTGVSLIRRPEVEKLTGLSRSSIYKLMSENRFPRPCRITGKQGGAVGWDRREIEAFLATRIAERDQAAV